MALSNDTFAVTWCRLSRDGEYIGAYQAKRPHTRRKARYNRRVANALYTVLGEYHDFDNGLSAVEIVNYIAAR